MIRLRRGWAVLACLALSLSAQEPLLHTWSLDHGRLEMTAGCSDGAMAVGSLQKPFVVRAWAQAHPETASPRHRCAGGAACWLKQGHGELGLAAALARSCNAYFRQLAQATPPADLAAAFEQAGFAPAPATPDLAIGLTGSGAPRIHPSQLLRAYQDLLREAWSTGEALRQEVLAGLREGARTGTAGGLGTWGLWAKTGTVPLDALRTEGFALAVDEAGLALLGRLRPGTGAQAAAALAGPLAARRPGQGTTAHDQPTVTVRLFDLLPATAFTVVNAGAAPIPDGRGFLGPGASRALHPGDRLGPGHLELRAADRGLRRRFHGWLRVAGGHLLATVTRRDYVAGVLAAELPQGDLALRLELGAAVLRFLARGRRHADADVCDSTHCAWFVGQGPRLDWSNPARARERPGEPAPEPLGDEDWARLERQALEPGPAYWTAHCGGRPLSPARLWGGSDTAAASCPRHPGETASWQRTWSWEVLERAFGPGLTAASLEPEAGVWGLSLVTAAGQRTCTFDEAHRRIAAVLGWDALPSPADEVELAEDGLRLRGRGAGHRVGLCLGK